MTRIDKYLWAVRLFKTRSMATNAVKSGKIFLNQQPIKASKEIKINDIISIKKQNALFSYRVISLLDKRVNASTAAQHIEDITPLSEKEKYATYIAAQKEYRDFDFGKPTKQDRRKLGKFLGGNI